MSARWSARARIFGLFGGHEVDGPHVHAAFGQPAAGGLAERIGGVDDAGEPEVEDADSSGGVEHEVAGLDVAVDDSLGMRGLEPAGGLDDASRRLGDGQRPAVADDAIEVAAFDEFHHQEMDAAIFVGINSGDDVGMFQTTGGLDFATESQARPVGRGRKRGEDLQSAHAPEPAVAGLEDHAHSALADLVEDDVVSDQKPAALLLVDGGGLIGVNLPAWTRARERPSDAVGGVGGQRLELLRRRSGRDRQRPREIRQIGNARGRGGIAGAPADSATEAGKPLPRRAGSRRDRHPAA